jgi:YVTN family beta-propeller protein
VLVLDLRQEKIVGEVPGLPRVHGVVADPDGRRLFATVTGEQRLAIIDATTLAPIGSVPAGKYPNGLAYAPGAHKVYVSNNTGTGIAVIDATAMKPLAPIDVGGGAGNSQYDAGTGHVFVAVHGRNLLAEIDPQKDAVVARHTLAGVRGCHGLLVDAGRRLAFAACDGRTLIAYDLQHRRVLGRAPLPREPDVLALDREWGRLYVACETGVVAVFQVEAAGVRPLGSGRVGPDAHTVALDPRTHHVYFPLADVGGHSAIRIMISAVPPTPAP